MFYLGPDDDDDEDDDYDPLTDGNEDEVDGREVIWIETEEEDEEEE